MNKLLTLLLLAVICLTTSCGKAVVDEGFQGIYEGKPRINPPHIVGTYPSTPFLFYIPTSGERPMAWNVQGLPQGLTFDSETGIISGVVDEAGDYKVVTKASNKLGSVTQELTISIGDKLVLTPPMGWNSWNTFGEHLTEALVIETAEAMIKNGMRDVGYTYINIDDFWQLAERGADGHIQINTEKFPNGIKYVADYLHARGFKLGIYSDAADRTCGGVCGSFGYEEIDAQDFASWGVDLLKYDYCHAPQEKQVAIDRYTVMGKALKNTKRSIVYSICEWGQLEPWTWAKDAQGHYWRTTFDIRDNWKVENYGHTNNGVMNIVDLNEPLSQYAEPGSWNDPDMLIVGIAGNSKSVNYGDGPFGCTPEQYRSHMSLWAMMASPLLSGNDVRNMDSITIETLTNPEIIAINQDISGKQAVRKEKNDSFEIWVKPFSGGTEVIAILNKAERDLEVVLNKTKTPFLTLKKSMRDVWEHKDVQIENNELKLNLSAYQCKVYVVK